jgi:hypothetical protein
MGYRKYYINNIILHNIEIKVQVLNLEGMQHYNWLIGHNLLQLLLVREATTSQCLLTFQ